jgi:TPR repeat protein
MYDKGEGVPKDDAEAVKWYRLAAEQGHAHAQFRLGAMYHSGDGVPKDQARAAEWYTKAAEQGNAEAQARLGRLYRIGAGVLKNDAEAAKWFALAARQGHEGAQFNLGLMYKGGEGVPKDTVEAASLFTRAAEQGHVGAQNFLGQMYATGDGVLKDDNEAVKWFLLAANQGSAHAQLNLGVMYDREPTDDSELIGPAPAARLARQPVEAMKWFARAAAQGEADAQYRLSALYWIGEGTPQDHVLAYSWASIAAAQGHERARELRDLLAGEMTREQIASGQRVAGAFRAMEEPLRSRNPPSNQTPAAPVTVTGSGFFVTSDGCFVTNHHVVAEATRIRVRTTAGTFPATLIRTDATNDIAILKVAGEFSALAVRGSRGVKIADRVATLGFPNPELQGEAGKYSSGEVAALSGPSDDPRFLQVSVPIQPGSSGGPLVDTSGSVVGVVVAQLDKITTFKLTGNIPENVNYAIKGTILLGVLESVPGLAEKVRSEPLKPATDAVEVAETLEAACGLVLVEK